MQNIFSDKDFFKKGTKIPKVKGYKQLLINNLMF